MRLECVTVKNEDYWREVWMPKLKEGREMISGVFSNDLETTMSSVDYRQLNAVTETLFF